MIVLVRRQVNPQYLEYEFRYRYLADAELVMCLGEMVQYVAKAKSNLKIVTGTSFQNISIVKDLLCIM